jgi:hypothetical protein
MALAAGLGVVVAALAAALAANPAVVEQFLAAVRDPGPGAKRLDEWWLPGPAFWLRQYLAPAEFWIQFVPCAIASIGLLAWRIRVGAGWEWPRALPAVVAISVLTAPYGGWIFDLPVLLVPVVWCTARLAAKPLLLWLFLAGQAAIVVVSFATAWALQHYFWVAPAALALCLMGLSVRGR